MNHHPEKRAEGDADRENERSEVRKCALPNREEGAEQSKQGEQCRRRADEVQRPIDGRRSDARVLQVGVAADRGKI